ncbi:ATP-binding protein [Telmatospirillum sp. J64-1]|uniref:ATP-binding protein n=1 Tax=Telmatospirillum sp. J64-1 TaxID=2502183 RepID=UPI00115EF61A|nr:ATP-binding protein [Telmatospirillum sp. J64-1]
MIRIPVKDQSEVGEARRQVQAMARSLGFDETEAGRAAIAATEAATNLVKHAGGGDILARPVSRGDTLGLEILALDKGRGIANLAQSMADGYSTAGSPGTGLGALMRQSQEFDIYAPTGKGTVVLARLWRHGVIPPRGPAEASAISLPMTGESVCGDSWAVLPRPDGIRVMVADGLGHGSFAAQAALEAQRIFSNYGHQRLEALMDSLHRALKPTRGAAIAIAELDYGLGNATFCGVGNIAAALLGPSGVRRLVSTNGTVGHSMRKILGVSYPCDRQTLLVMHSDGLGGQVSLDSYPGLTMRDSAIIAGVLFRDLPHRHDDHTLLVAKATP